MDMTVRGLTLQNTSISSIESALNSFERLEFALDQLVEGRAVTGAYASVMDHIFRLNTTLKSNVETAHGNIAYTDVAREVTELNSKLILIQSGNAILQQNNDLRRSVSQQEINMITLGS